MTHMEGTVSIVKLTLKLLFSSQYLCDYTLAYILVEGIISVKALEAGGGNNNKEVIFENLAPFSDCISETIIHK